MCKEGFSCPNIRHDQMPSTEMFILANHEFINDQLELKFARTNIKSATYRLYTDS